VANSNCGVSQARPKAADKAADKAAESGGLRRMGGPSRRCPFLAQCTHLCWLRRLNRSAASKRTSGRAAP